MRRIFIILSALTIVAYLICGRNQLIADLEEHAERAMNPHYSGQVDLTKKHTFTWLIKEGEWSYTDGEAKLLLTFNHPPSGEEKKNYWKVSYPLKVKISAYAVTENNIRANRLNQNYFFTSDEPMKNKTNLWAGWPDERMEYPLGSLQRFPKEDLFIELVVQMPDDLLSKATPRLKLVGDYDPAALGFIPLAKIFRDIGLLLCLGGLLYLTIQALGSRKGA